MAGRVGTHTVLGREVASPVEIRHATAFTAMMSVDAAAAGRMIGPTGLEPVTGRPGRAACALVFVDHVDGDLGPYNEFGVCFLVKHHRPGAGATGMRAVLRGEVCAYIHRLPVDGDFTLAAGREIWGFPKTLADFDCRHRSIRPYVVGDDPDRLLVPRRHAAGDAADHARRVGANASRRRPDHPAGPRVRRRTPRPRHTLMSSSISHLSMTFGDAEVIDSPAH